MKIFNKILKYLAKKHFKLEFLIIGVIFLFLTSIYLLPVFQGLIILPLDLLFSNYLPWYSPGNILLKNPYMQDSIVQMYPWRHLVYQSLTQGIIPFWNPYQFMGGPFLALTKPLVFYPLNILFVFGEVTSWNMLLFLQIFLSLSFSYLLSREFKVPVIPSIMSAFAFALSSVMIGVLEFGSEGQVILWIPLFIFFAKKYLDLEKGVYLFLMGLVITFSIFAGHLQYTVYGLLVLFGFILAYGNYVKAPKNKYLFLFLAITLGVLMSAVLLLPALELFANSHRGLIKSPQVFISGLLDPILLLRLLSADFFGSPIAGNLSIGYIESSGYFDIIPLFFAFFAGFFMRKNIFVKIFTGVFITSVLLSLQHIGSILYFLKIPLITSGSGGRIFILVLFSGAILSGFGLSGFCKVENYKKALISLLFFVLFAISIFAFKILALDDRGLINDFIHNIKFSILVLLLFFPIALSYFFIRKKFKFSNNIFMIIVVALTFVELFAFGYRFLTFSNSKFLYPNIGVTNFVKNYSQKDLSRSYGITEPELSTYLNIFSAETYNPLYLLRNAKLLQALQGKQEIDITFDNKYFLSNQEKLKEVLDFLGTSLIIDDKDRNPSIDYFLTAKYQGVLSLLYKDKRYAVYLNKDAFPRAYLVYKYVVAKNDKEVLFNLKKSPASFRDKIILEQKLPLSIKEGTGSAVLINHNINFQKFKIITNKPAIFYISDTYYPGWLASVNSVSTKIYRANYNFRAILVPAGESIIEFNYMPNNFILAIIISLTSLFFLIVTAFFTKKFRSKR